MASNPHDSKLQLSYNDTSFQPINTLHNSSASASASASASGSAASVSPPPQPQQPPSQFSNPPAFDTSMALTVLLLLTAFFFMGFFSIYLRRFSSNQTPPPPALSSIRLNYTNADDHRPSIATASRKGVGPEVIKSLPVYDYYHGDANYQIDCAICLGEFVEKESVKMIPYCKHVFHLECIDTWLEMHVTCPVCRGTQFFEAKGCGGIGGGGYSGRSAEENSDSRFIEVGTLSSSGRGSVSGERILVRTSGFLCV